PGDPSTWLPALRQGCFYQPAFNLLLLVPLGVYLRYYFKRGWTSTLLLVFFVTLCFELIQYSALFGIYPRPYRVFDVDDLLLNTLGGMLGFWLTPALSWLLPTRQQLDTLSYRKG
ncbi:VanZ family protein, partial [Bittarella massiliensis (ex Durand et al. 2017)]